jgi:hypothetical protein
VKGLKQDGWQIITRTKTPKEIREEYERLAKEKAEKRLRELTNTLVMIVNDNFKLRIIVYVFQREMLALVLMQRVYLIVTEMWSSYLNLIIIFCYFLSIS